MDTTKLEGLRRQLEAAQGELAEVKKEVAAAESEFQAEEVNAVIEQRPPSERLRKKLANAGQKHEALRARVAALNRAITALREQEERERGQREHEAVEVFRKKAAPTVKRLRQALDESRSVFVQLVELMEREAITLPDVYDFVFPKMGATDPKNPFDGMQLRFAQLSTLNGLATWAKEDAMHSRIELQEVI